MDVPYTHACQMVDRAGDWDSGKDVLDYYRSDKVKTFLKVIIIMQAFVICLLMLLCDIVSSVVFATPYLSHNFSLVILALTLR